MGWRCAAGALRWLPFWLENAKVKSTNKQKEPCLFAKRPEFWKDSATSLQTHLSKTNLFVTTAMRTWQKHRHRGARHPLPEERGCLYGLEGLGTIDSAEPKLPCSLTEWRRGRWGLLKRGSVSRARYRAYASGQKSCCWKRKELSVQMWSHVCLLFVFVVGGRGVQFCWVWLSVLITSPSLIVAFFFTTHKGSWVRKKTPCCSHSVYTRKAWPGIRTGSRTLSGTVSARNFSAFRDACSHTVRSTDKR